MLYKAVTSFLEDKSVVVCCFASISFHASIMGPANSLDASMCEDPSCFGQGRTWEACCDAIYGPAGNQELLGPSVNQVKQRTVGFIWPLKSRVAYCERLTF